MIKNNLLSVNPSLAKEWDYEKNGKLTPSDVTPGSNKKVWWKCKNGHEWQASVYTRNKGIGCPYCANKKAGKDNCLQTTNPELAKEWHPTKNGKLTPSDVLAGSGKRVWWKCKNGHEWQISPNGRRKTGCPYCANQKVCKDNCLQTTNPELAKEWHPTKNGKLTPSDVTPGSHKKVWWKCKNGHEWQASVYTRNKGTGCNICNIGNQTSFPEQAIYFYTKKIYKDCKNRYRLNNKYEIDIFIPSLNIGIEYDGIYYHKNNKTSYEKKKNIYLKNNSIILIRIKEKCNIKKCYIKNNIIYYNENYNDISLNEMIKYLFKYIENITKKKYNIQIDIKKERHIILNNYIKKEIEDSFGSKYPELAKYWNYEKNMNVNPFMVKPHSVKKVWWKCEKGHEYLKCIDLITKGIGCPYCANQKACKDNCLQTTNPELAKEWHPTKNGKLTPSDVLAGSNKKAWWKCKNGHEWQASVYTRNKGIGCPYCSRYKAGKDNCLKTTNPELAKEWHPTKNGNLTPSDVLAGSDKKAWWKCKNGHEWQASISYRKKGTGCPYCSGKKVCKENSLATTHPKIAKEWNYKKNSELKPTDIRFGSEKKVWWKCKNGHEWQARICDRTKTKKGLCPYCSGMKK